MIGESLGRAEDFSDGAPKLSVMMRSRSDLKVVKRAWISALPSETEQQEEDLDMVFAVCGCCDWCCADGTERLVQKSSSICAGEGWIVEWVWLSMSIGDCAWVRAVEAPENGNGEPDAMGGVENIIGGGGIADAGELNLFASQLPPGVALVNNESQDERRSFTGFGIWEGLLREHVGTLCGISSNTVNLSSEPETACPLTFAKARWYSSALLTSLAMRMRTPGLVESGEKRSLERT
jgi:hypothetical protein